MYKVSLTAKAAASLRNLPAKIQRRISAKIEAISQNPRLPQVEKLQGSESLYRIRAGDYRIVYEIHDDQLVIVVVRIGHRREVYRKL